MAVLSSSGIALELLLTRVLSVMYWQSLVYVVITVALLGFGASGTLLAVVPAVQRGDLGRTVARLTVLYAVFAVLSVWIVSQIQIDAVRFAASASTWVRLAAVLLILTVPFLCLGTCINLMLVRLNSEINRMYFWNLCGSGIGALVFFALLGPLGAPKLVLIIVVLPLLASVMILADAGRSERIAWLVITVLLLAGCAIPGFSPFSFRPCPSKIMGAMTDPAQHPDAKVEYTKWTPFGRLDLFSSKDYSSQGEDGTPVPMKFLTTDGDAYTWLQKATSDLTKLPRFSRGRNFAYLLKKDPEVLCIGIGGGQDIKFALGHGSKKIIGVDINPETIDIIKSRYISYSGDLQRLGDVTFVVSEGRSFARRSKETFDIVYMNGVDTFTALSSGAYTMVENYLYTKEAFVDYLHRLKDDGILTVSRYAFRIPRETARVFATALAALKEIGIDDPTRHVIVNIDEDWGTVLIKRVPFTPGEIEKIEGLGAQWPHTVVYYPGLEEEPLTDELLERHGRKVLDAVPFEGAVNVYAALAQSYRQGTESEFFERYPYDLRPVSDDRPFFYHFFRLADMFSKSTGRVKFEASGGPLGWSLLLFLVAFSIVSSVVLIILPLLWYRRHKVATRNAGRLIVFFTAIGLAYISIEIAAIQRFSLFLGHPVLSMACMMTAFLCISGVGSLVSSKWKASPHALVFLGASVIVLVVAVYTVVVPDLLARLLSISLVWRVLLSVTLISPLALFMGVFFPVGINRLTAVSPGTLPWACAANGSASVVGSVCSILFAIQFGFSRVLLAAALLYVVALLAAMAGALRPSKS